MKKVYILLCFSILLVGISSCKKCQSCKAAGFADVEICKDDFASESLFDGAISTYELAGWDCK